MLKLITCPRSFPKKGFPKVSKPSTSGKAQTTIIDIPIPKVDTTELEVVHVFPQGMGPSMFSGYSGYNNYPQGIPSFSIITNENGTSKTSNVWGFNPGQMRNKNSRVSSPGKSLKGVRKLIVDIPVKLNNKNKIQKSSANNNKEVLDKKINSSGMSQNHIENTVELKIIQNKIDNAKLNNKLVNPTNKVLKKNTEADLSIKKII